MDLPPDVDFFKSEVREYEDIDSEIKSLNDKIKPIQQRIKELKAKKSHLQGNLCEFMSKNKIDACNVSGLDKIPKRTIQSATSESVPAGLPVNNLVGIPELGVPTPVNLSQLDSSRGLLPQSNEVQRREHDSISISTSASSVRLSYSTSTRTKPATKEFIKGQCYKFFTDAWQSNEFRRLNESEKGKFLFEYLYNPDDRETVEKPVLKKQVVN